MSLLDQLNGPQREAVETTEGPLLVLAGAGSGKTRVLTYRIAHLVHGLGIDPGSILAFTFTNKAAGEMKERVEHLLDGPPRGMWVGTFHSTGVRILRRRGGVIGIEPGFTIYDTDDQETLVRRILKDLQLAEKELTPKTVRNAISSAKNALIGPELFAETADSFRAQKIASVFAEYQKRLRAANALDFDDLIGEPLRLFDEDPASLRWFNDRFQYVLVDEYQDTNAAQARLITHLASGSRNLCVVGDDDQSIYGWRGADVTNILEFEKAYPEARVVRLEQNYRSTGNILAAANAVVSNNTARKEKALWTEKGSGDLLSLTIAWDEEDEARRVVATVTDEVNRLGTPLAGVAVLYRTNAQSRALETAFRNAAIPYELVGGTAFYQRREVKDILAYLRLTVNEQDDVALTRVLNVPKRGIGQTTLARLAEHASREGTSLLRAMSALDMAMELSASARAKLSAFAQLIDDFRPRVNEPVGEVLFDLVGRINYLDYLEHDDPGSATERAENVEELVAGARLFSERNETGDVASFLNEVALLTDVDRADDKAEKIRLMTVHNAKGLEFPVVCISGLEEGLMPHVSSMDSEEGTEEERRLFYVALTRGKERVHLFSAMSRQRWGGGSASLLSRFAEEIPDTLLEITEAPRVAGWGERPRRVDRDRGYERPVRNVEYADPGPRRTLGTILHPTFGRGDVIGQEGRGPDARLTVVFPGNIKKKIVARYAQWEESHADF